MVDKTEEKERFSQSPGTKKRVTTHPRTGEQEMDIKKRIASKGPLRSGVKRQRICCHSPYRCAGKEETRPQYRGTQAEVPARKETIEKKKKKRGLKKEKPLKVPLNLPGK